MGEGVFGFVFGILLGVVSSIALLNIEWRTDLVNRGHAIYCPLNGNFAFIGECDK